VDGNEPMKNVLGDQVELSVSFLEPGGSRVLVRMDANGRPSVALVERSKTGNWDRRDCAGIKAAVRTVLELEIPFECLRVRTHDRISFVVALNRNEAEVERYPRHRPIDLDVPDEHFATVNWTA